MKTVEEGCDEETPREWLSLRLGEFYDSDLSTCTSPKMFSCEICTKSFHNVRALNGHQAVHTKRHFEHTRNWLRNLREIGVKRPPGVQTHSFVQKLSRQGIPVSTKYSESNKDCGVKPLEELSDSEKLDLNLKL